MQKKEKSISILARKDFVNKLLEIVCLGGDGEITNDRFVSAAIAVVFFQYQV